VFDPYFSTKKVGSGLGLASSYSIIKNHEGLITVDSKWGQGTTFHIFLPVSEEAPTPSELPETEPLAGEGKILIMDDDESVAQVAGEMLKHMGYAVSVAKEGEETIALYRKALDEKTPFDAVILDLTIPGGMGGKETIEKLLEIDPDVKAIVSSGYANDPIMADYGNFGFSRAIAKPYTIQNLNKVLFEVMQADAP
jgi:CheY-like chemotaxis protein